MSRYHCDIEALRLKERQCDYMQGTWGISLYEKVRGRQRKLLAVAAAGPCNVRLGMRGWVSTPKICTLELHARVVANMLQAS